MTHHDNDLQDHNSLADVTQCPRRSTRNGRWFLRRTAMLPLTCSCLLLGSVLGCSDETDAGGEGSLVVLLEAEEAVTEGLEPGDGVENIQDGWTVEFEQYAVSIGEVLLRYSTDASISAGNQDLVAVDLTEVPESGLALWSFDTLRPGRWDFNYAIHGAESATRDPSLDESSFETMVQESLTYLIDGTLTQEGGESCPPSDLVDAGDAMPNDNTSPLGDPCYDAPSISFRIEATAEAVFGPCEIDGSAGVAIPDGGDQQVAITIHGDHLFFNGFPEGDEGGTSRLAQWLANCDLDLDGTVTMDELAAIAPAQILDPAIFQLGGSPIQPLETMADYVNAQLQTQGHFQGEGECPIDGVEHDH